MAGKTRVVAVSGRPEGAGTAEQRWTLQFAAHGTEGRINGGGTALLPGGTCNHATQRHFSAGRGSSGLVGFAELDVDSWAGAGPRRGGNRP
jgi:hypothetical protein